MVPHYLFCVACDALVVVFVILQANQKEAGMSYVCGLLDSGSLIDPESDSGRFI